MEGFTIILFLITIIWLFATQQRLDNISRRLDKFEVGQKDSEEPVESIVSCEPVIAEVQPESEPEQFEQSVETLNIEETAPIVENSPCEEIKEQNLNQAVQDCLDGKKVKNNKKSEKVKSNTNPSGFQEIFLGNILNKIGAFAIIIAVIILINLVSPYIVITPLMKIIFGFLLGGGMTAGGLYLHKREDLKKYSEVVLGTGIGTLFITTFCAYSVFNLFNSVVVISIGVALLVGTFVLAHRMQTPSMLVIALIGGYLTPCFSGADYTVCLWYLIFLNMVSLIFTLRNPRFNIINFINLVITMFAFLPYVIEPNNPLFPIVLWGIYLVYDIIRDKSNEVDNALSIINYIILTLFSVIMFRGSHSYIAYLLAPSAVVYTVLARKVKQHSDYLYKTYVNFALLNIWLGSFFLFDTIYNVLIWSVIALALAFDAGKLKLKFLTPMMWWYFITAIVGALLAKFNSEYILAASYTPVLNIRTLVFAVPVFASLISVYFYVNNKEDNTTPNIFLFNGLTLTYIYLLCETLSVLGSVFSKQPDFMTFNQGYIFLIIGFLYALNAKSIYRTTNYILFDISSAVIYALSLIGLLLIGFGYSEYSAYIPVLNLRMAVYILAICTLLNINKSEFSKYGAVILGFILAHLEGVGIANLHENLNFIISLIWVLYSGVVTTVGILQNKRFLINSGIGIIILTIFRIFIFDLAKMDALYKLIAFLALGIILLYVSYVYTSNKKKLK